MSQCDEVVSAGWRQSRAVFALATLVSSSSCRRAVAPSGTGDAAGLASTGTWAGLRVHTIGARKQPRQIVILLHGWGAPGDDLVPLGEVLAAPGRLLIFPEAPLQGPGGGRAWWHLDLARLQAARASGEERDLRQEVPPDLAAARTQVSQLVAEVSRRAGVPSTSVWLGGFSQGAMLATDVALATPGAVGGLVVLSGSLISEAVWVVRLKDLPPLFPIFMSHGRADPILPFRLAEAFRDHVLANHHAVTWVPFNGGHEIPTAVITELRTFLAAHPPGELGGT